MIVTRNHVYFCLCLLSSQSQLEKHLSNYLVEPIDLNVIVKRRLNFEKTDLPLIGVEGKLEFLKVGKNTCNCCKFKLNSTFLIDLMHRKSSLNVELSI